MNKKLIWNNNQFDFNIIIFFNETNVYVSNSENNITTNLNKRDINYRAGILY